MTSVGRSYRYVARIGRHTGRYGQVVVVEKWHRSKVLVCFPDRWRAVVPGRCLRKVAELEQEPVAEESPGAP